MSTKSNGNDGCKCIDVSSTISSITDRACTFTSYDGEVQDGVLLAPNTEQCVPYSYGSGECRQHDLFYDKKCISGVFLGNMPSYCAESWCYVDRETCKNSNEIFFKSDYFSEDEASLFYSYSTCNSTSDDWLAWAKGITQDVLEGMNIYAGVPGMQAPFLYKTTASGEITTKSGEEYYDGNVQFEGLYIEYIKNLIGISGGDIGNVTYSHGTKGARQIHPTSSYTALVQDIESGIFDIGVGPFWVTGQRLKMSAFTIPIDYDKTVLAIPRPGSSYSLSYESAKVFGPFTWSMWGTVLLVVFMSAILSVWFAGRQDFEIKRYGQIIKSNGKQKRYTRWSTYFRLSLDSFLQKGGYFFSAGVEHDSEAPLPYNLLMFGFGFFILIAVSAYVANLAAFLTQRNMSNSVTTMEEAVAFHTPICAHPALEEELLQKWPNANFIFNRSGNGWHGVLDMYEGKKCSVLAIGRVDNELDIEFMGRMCENELVLTDSLIIETPIAFPVRPDLASGLSYWIHHGERYKDVSLTKLKDEYWEEASAGLNCVTELSQVNQEEVDEFAQISPTNMILPIIVFVAFAIGAMLLQIYDEHHGRKGRATLVGRKSSLDLYADEKAKNSVMESLKLTKHRLTFVAGRRYTEGSDCLDDDDDTCHKDKTKTGSAADPTSKINHALANFIGTDFPGNNLSDDETNSMDDDDDFDVESRAKSFDSSSVNDVFTINGSVSDKNDSPKDELDGKCCARADLESQSLSTMELSSRQNIESNRDEGEASIFRLVAKRAFFNPPAGIDNKNSSAELDASKSVAFNDSCQYDLAKNRSSLVVSRQVDNAGTFSNEQMEEIVRNCHEILELFQGIPPPKKGQ